VLDAFHVALIGVLLGGPDSDDTVGAWYFELEVGVVRDHHEPGVAGAPKNGVVCPMESNHPESESFLPEVGESTKTDRQVDPLNGLSLFSRHDSMEAPDAGSEVCPHDSQKVKSLGINDVKTTASVHEHLGEACVGDDGIDDEWVDPRIGDEVWVVITVESDGHLRPVKEEGGHEMHGEDLSTFPFALLC
jgi:hypothetical protein